MPHHDPATQHGADPLIIPAPTGEPTYIIHQQPPTTGALDRRYQTPPGTHLSAGPDGHPIYVVQQYDQEPRGTTPAVSPLLLNATLAVALLLGAGAALWMIASFIAALAELLQALAMVAAVLLGGAVALRLLGGGDRLRVDVQTTAGRGRRRVATRTRIRR